MTTEQPDPAVPAGVPPADPVAPPVQPVPEPDAPTRSCRPSGCPAP